MKVLRILFLILFIVPLCYAYTGSGERGGIASSFHVERHMQVKVEPLFLSERLPSGHEGHGGRRPDNVHSEHRATPVKRFYLNQHVLSEDARAFVLRPDGSIREAVLRHDKGVWTVSIDTKPMDGSMDGIFNLYVVDQQVLDNTLVIRVAKMNVINHSCGWGHKFKFDRERLRPKYLESIPFEIVAHDLWDRNFHLRTASGDRISFTVLRSGRPSKAGISIRTEGGWTKSLSVDESGMGSFQLIREYYPERWADFNSRKRTGIILVAEYEKEERGLYNDMPYERIRYITTLPWRYQVSKKEYSSYTYGLLILTFASLVSALTVYLYRKEKGG